MTPQELINYYKNSVPQGLATEGQLRVLVSNLLTIGATARYQDPVSNPKEAAAGLIKLYAEKSGKKLPDLIEDLLKPSMVDVKTRAGLQRAPELTEGQLKSVLGNSYISPRENAQLRSERSELETLMRSRSRTPEQIMRISELAENVHSREPVLSNVSLADINKLQAKIANEIDLEYQKNAAGAAYVNPQKKEVIANMRRLVRQQPSNAEEQKARLAAAYNNLAQADQEIQADYKKYFDELRARDTGFSDVELNKEIGEYRQQLDKNLSNELENSFKNIDFALRTNPIGAAKLKGEMARQLSVKNSEALNKFRNEALDFHLKRAIKADEIELNRLNMKEDMFNKYRGFGVKSAEEQNKLSEDVAEIEKRKNLIKQKEALEVEQLSEAAERDQFQKNLELQEKRGDILGKVLHPFEQSLSRQEMLKTEQAGMIGRDQGPHYFAEGGSVVGEPVRRSEYVDKIEQRAQELENSLSNPSALSYLNAINPSGPLGILNKIGQMAAMKDAGRQKGLSAGIKVYDALDSKDAAFKKMFLQQKMMKELAYLKHGLQKDLMTRASSLDARTAASPSGQQTEEPQLTSKYPVIGKPVKIPPGIETLINTIFSKAPLAKQEIKDTLEKAKKVKTGSVAGQILGVPASIFSTAFGNKVRSWTGEGREEDLMGLQKGLQNVYTQLQEINSQFQKGNGGVFLQKERRAGKGDITLRPENNIEILEGNMREIEAQEKYAQVMAELLSKGYSTSQAASIASKMAGETLAEKVSEESGKKQSTDPELLSLDEQIAQEELSLQNLAGGLSGE